MMILGKLALVLFLIFWTMLGGYLILKFNLLFGRDEGTDSDTAGSKSLSIAHFASMWIGGFALAAYFLFR